MTKRKYVKKLSAKLGKLPAGERDSAVQYYAEIIDDMLDENKSWELIISRIGAPNEAARRVIVGDGGKRRRGGDDEYISPRHDAHSAHPVQAPSQGAPPAQQYPPTMQPSQYMAQPSQYAAQPQAQPVYTPPTANRFDPYTGEPMQPHRPKFDPETGVPLQPAYTAPPPAQPIQPQYVPPQPQPAYAPPAPQPAYVQQPAQEVPAYVDNRPYAAPSGRKKTKRGEFWKWYFIFGIITIPLTIGLLGGVMGLLGGALGIVAAGLSLVIAGPAVIVSSIVFGAMAQSGLIFFVLLAGGLIITGVGLIFLWLVKIFFLPVKLLLKKAFGKGRDAVKGQSN